MEAILVLLPPGVGLKAVLAQQLVVELGLQQELVSVPEQVPQGQEALVQVLELE